jgi:PAS domain S-box-containing protein
MTVSSQKFLSTKTDLSSVLERIKDGIVCFDAEMNYTYLNSYAGEILGRKPEDLIGKNYWKEFPEAKDTPFANAYVKALETQEPIILEDYYQPWDRWFENRIYPSKDGLSIFFSEITERKQAEEEILRQSKFINALVVTVPAIIYIYDFETQSNVYSNDGIERLLGYTPQEIKDMGSDVFVRLIHPDDLPGVIAFQNAIAQAKDEDELEVEYRMRHKNGRWLNLLSYERPYLRTSDGSLKRKIGVAFDITERKRAEDQLGERERQLSTLISNLPGLAYRCRNDANFTTEFVSDGIADVTGYPAEDFREHRREFGQLIHPDDQEQVSTEIQAALKENRPFELTYRILHATGEQKWVWERGAGIKNAKDEVEALEGFVTDITERKRAEEALRKSEETFSVIFKKAPFAAGLTNIPDGTFVEVNEESERIFGFSREEIIGKTSLELGMYSDPEVRQRAAEFFRQQGYIRNLDMRLQMRTGEIRDVLINSDLVEIRGVKHVLTTANDITERKRAEEELQKSKQLYWELTERLNEVVYSADPDTFVATFVNSSIEKLYGYSASEWLANPQLWEEMIFDEDRQRTLQELSDSMARRTGDTLEYRIRRRNGEIRWVEDHVTWTVDEHGKIASMNGVMYDITERKRAEEALRISEANYRTLVESASDGIFVTDAHGRVLDVNPLGCRMLNYTREEILGLSIPDIVQEEEVARVATELGRLNAGEVVRSEWQFRRKDGTLLPGEVSGTTLPDGRQLGILRDITERKNAEVKMQESEERLRLFIEHAPASLAMFDRDMRYLAVSRRWLVDYNLHDGTIIGRSHYEIFPEIQERWREVHRRALSGEIIKNDEDRFERADGTVQWLRWEVRPWHFADSSIGGIVIFSEDITAIKRSEEQLKSLSQRLLEVQEQEKRYLAKELHDEFGQALTAAKINLQGLVQTTPQKQSKHRLEKSISILDKCLTQVRNLSLDLRPSLLDDLGLEPTIRWFLDHHTKIAGIKEQLYLDLKSKRFPPLIETACFRIIQEAVTNILRHAKAKNVSVSLEQTESEIIFSIHDDGIGFDVEAAKANAQRGKSLGLVNIQERAMLLGGTVEITSTPKKGTTVKVKLPIAKQSVIANPPQILL